VCWADNQASSRRPPFHAATRVQIPLGSFLWDLVQSGECWLIGFVAFLVDQDGSAGRGGQEPILLALTSSSNRETIGRPAKPCSDSFPSLWRAMCWSSTIPACRITTVQHWKASFISDLMFSGFRDRPSEPLKRRMSWITTRHASSSKWRTLPFHVPRVNARMWDAHGTGRMR